MVTGMPEIEDVPDSLSSFGQWCHAVPDPPGAIDDDHQGQRRKLCAAALHLNLEAREELVGVLDAGDIGSVRQAHLIVCILIFGGGFIGSVLLLYDRHGSYLRVSVLDW